ncbi:hypothetical protein MHK_007600, partial [Candidatus Magnetomorum sp. HK-1]
MGISIYLDKEVLKYVLMMIHGYLNLQVTFETSFLSILSLSFSMDKMICS